MSDVEVIHKFITDIVTENEALKTENEKLRDLLSQANADKGILIEREHEAQE